MFKIALAVLAATWAFAAGNPLEESFPDGYWDREVGYYGGRGGTNYNVSFATLDPAAKRAEVEKVFAAAGAKMTGFTDQTAAMGAMEIPGMRQRPAYNLTYQMPDAKAAPAAKRLFALGRLINYGVNSPFAGPQAKDVEERISWIEKEKAKSAEALKTMPVSRALLDGKLKRLKAMADAAKAGAGQATVTVVIMREEPETAGKPGAPNLMEE